MLSNEIYNLFNEAKRLAREYRHDVVTIEHFFLACLQKEEIQETLNELPSRPKREYLASIIEAYLKELIPVCKVQGRIDRPVASEDLITLLADFDKNLLKQGIFSSFDELSLANVFYKILNRYDSFTTSMIDTLQEEYAEEHPLPNNIGLPSIEDISAMPVESEGDNLSSREEFLERRLSASDIDDSEQGFSITFGGLGKPSFLEKETEEKGTKGMILIDLVDRARQGLIDDIVGRKEEFSLILEILTRYKKANPILVGEAGVGKSALVDKLALEIAHDNIEGLKGTKVYSLNVNALVSGTSYRGDFEKRLEGIISTIVEEDAILFIDEVHTIVGSGSTNSQNLDGANVLKPLLASSQFKCIGATTFDEYRQYIEGDKALSRRFMKVVVKEPDDDATLQILEGVASIYERFHKVKYTKDALRACIDLSNRYINTSSLPDRAIDLLDQVASYMRLNHSTKRLINKQDVSKSLCARLNLAALEVDRDKKDILASLEDDLKNEIFSQDDAIKNITDALKISFLGLGAKSKPIASFLFTGSSGVGKSELCRALAKSLGVEYIKLDMSEFSSPFDVSKLIGAPAGYAGHDEGGVLVNKIRKAPYSVLLLDEIEKADKTIYNALLQVLDEARLVDSKGREASFNNVIIVMTSNITSNAAKNIGFGTSPSDVSSFALLEEFPREFINRLDKVVHFNDLKLHDYERIIAKELALFNQSLSSEYNMEVELSIDAIHALASEIVDTNLTARDVSRLLNLRVILDVSNYILNKKISRTRQKTCLLYTLDKIEEDKALLVRKEVKAGDKTTAKGVKSVKGVESKMDSTKKGAKASKTSKSVELDSTKKATKTAKIVERKLDSTKKPAKTTKTKVDRAKTVETKLDRAKGIERKLDRAKTTKAKSLSTAKASEKPRRKKS